VFGDEVVLNGIVVVGAIVVVVVGADATLIEALADAFVPAAVLCA
jgi:hypothetical protein